MSNWQTGLSTSSTERSRHRLTTDLVVPPESGVFRAASHLTHFCEGSSEQELPADYTAVGMMIDRCCAEISTTCTCQDAFLSALKLLPTGPFLFLEPFSLKPSRLLSLKVPVDQQFVKWADQKTRRQVSTSSPLKKKKSSIQKVVCEGVFFLLYIADSVCLYVGCDELAPCPNCNPKLVGISSEWGISVGIHWWRICSHVLTWHQPANTNIQHFWQFCAAVSDFFFLIRHLFELLLQSHF